MVSKGNDIIATKNRHGFVHSLSETSEKFISHAKEARAANIIDKNVYLDIGAATGVATIPLLDLGAKVIALDKDPAHLAELKNNVEISKLHNLRSVVGSFPDALMEIEEKSVDAALISQVLGFVEGEDIRKGFSLLFDRLKNGGMLFIVNYTPFHSVFKDFIKTYLERKEALELWPGYCDNVAKYCHDKEVLRNLPNKINLMDQDVLVRELKMAGFNIVSDRYYDNGVPEQFRLDGREWVEVIARR